MMKRITIILASLLLAGNLWSCYDDYDDSALWKEIDVIKAQLDDLNKDINSLRRLIDAVESGKYIKDVVETSTGYTIVFSDESRIVISHGKNGSAGADAPIIGVKQDDDEVYYWTITTEGVTDWLLDRDRNKIPVSGRDGFPGGSGADGITPVLGVDESGYWTVDYGSGTEQILDAGGNPVKAIGSGDSLFVKVEDNGRYYTFYLANGTTIDVQKRFGAEIVIDAKNDEYFQYGQERMFTMQLREVVNASSTGPRYWDIYVDIDNSELWITAPAAGVGQSSGTVRVSVTGKDGSTVTAAFAVKADTYELYTVTFEGEYWQPFVAANRKPGVYSTWAWMGGSDPDYIWKDDKSQLHTMTPRGGMLSYPWILSSYNSNSLDTGGYANDSHDLYVYNPFNQNSMTGGGNNGSDNFIIGYGYEDYMWDMGKPRMGFADGMARTIKSIYVNSTCYFLGVAAAGNPLSPPLGEGEDVILHATGYDGSGNSVGTVTMVYATTDYSVSEWTEWDLSELGDIVELEFNMTGGTDNGYGFSLPAYYAMDDITVILQ